MNTLTIILGIVLVILFFLNIKNAADVLCRIVGGFAFLLLYNMIAPVFSLQGVGINLISSLVAGVMGLPGGVLLVCASLFL